MEMDKDFYNESSALKLGWDPTWFAENHFAAGFSRRLLILLPDRTAGIPFVPDTTHLRGINLAVWDRSIDR